MADEESLIDFEDIPLDDARRIGRGPRMEPMLMLKPPCGAPDSF
jgi:hypothetical protein